VELGGHAAAGSLDYSQMPLVIDDPNASPSSYWDYWEQDYNSSDYDSRNDPTSGAYYKPWEGEENKSLAVRNVLVSNIGLIAKMEPASGALYVLSADLRTAQPLSGVKITCSRSSGTRSPRASRTSREW